ncbi:TPA: hypothetical protein SMF87_004580 [Serratia marcescens]|nr:hypothetical protein [Serratia marcescens]
MKIESIIRRANGTKVRMDSENYHFKPSAADPRHLAEVTREAHISAFLRIPEGYRLPDGEEIDEELEKKIDDALTLKSSAIHNANYPIGGKDITLPELIVMAHQDSGLSIDEWNALEDEDRYEIIDRTLEDLHRAAAKAPVEPKEVKDEQAPERDAMPDSEADEDDGQQDGEQDDAGEQQNNEPPAEQQPTELDRDALVEKYKAMFGKNPHHKLSAERLQQIIDEA